MNRGSFSKSPREDRQKLEKKSKTFKTISKYFSKKEWARLGYSEKITYVYMKRNYETMTSLGLKSTPPAFMCPKNGAKKSKHCDSKIKNPMTKGASNMQGRKRQKVVPKEPVKGKKHSKLVPGTSGPEEAQKQPCPQAKASKETSGKRNNLSYLITDLCCHRCESHVTGDKAFKFSELQIPSPQNGNKESKFTDCSKVFNSRDFPGSPVVKTVSIWAHRLRKRKPVAYEEISDPEEED
uniref:KRAB-related domain-containing protein n=1 Tax=Moschus moschiferus TaxID=68415 RepID=A0A8C6FNB1_MOSMO